MTVSEPHLLNVRTQSPHLPAGGVPRTGEPQVLIRGQYESQEQESHRPDSPHLPAGEVPRTGEHLTRRQYVPESQEQECPHPPTTEGFNGFLAYENDQRPTDLNTKLTVTRWLLSVKTDGQREGPFTRKKGPEPSSSIILSSPDSLGLNSIST